MLIRNATLAMLGLVFLGGCQPVPSNPAKGSSPWLGGADQAAGPRPRSTPSGPYPDPTDPCAERLHALCGPVLLYYQLHKRLPPTIDDLRDIGGPDPDIEFDCPVSHKPYVYFFGGVRRPGQPGFVIIADPEPSHKSMRWTIVVEEPRNKTDALVTRVEAEPESLFQNLPKTVPATAPAPPAAPSPSPSPSGRGPG